MHKKRHKLNTIENCPENISKIDEKLNPTEKKSLMPEIQLQSVWMLL